MKDQCHASNENHLLLNLGKRYGTKYSRADQAQFLGDSL